MFLLLDLNSKDYFVFLQFLNQTHEKSNFYYMFGNILCQCF